MKTQIATGTLAGALVVLLAYILRGQGFDAMPEEVVASLTVVTTLLVNGGAYVVGLFLSRFDADGDGKIDKPNVPLAIAFLVALATASLVACAPVSPVTLSEDERAELSQRRQIATAEIILSELAEDIAGAYNAGKLSKADVQAIYPTLNAAAQSVDMARAMLGSNLPAGSQLDQFSALVRQIREELRRRNVTTRERAM
jgi:hypothetical protein